MKFVVLALFGAYAKSVPTVVFHGFGDACENPGMQHFTQNIADGTGAVAKCFGAPAQVTGSFEKYAEESCAEIAADPTFAGEFNTLGLSQGSLFARYIVEECEMPGKVRNMVSIGGPHMGTTTLPHCTEGFFCNFINYFVKKLVYLPIVQNNIAPAGYFRDVNHWDKYLSGSTFLPALNNEIPNDLAAATRKERFADLNSALFVMFT